MSVRIKLINALQAVAVIVCLTGIGSLSARAQTQAAVVNEAPYTQEYEGHINVRADRTVSDTFTQRFKILTPSAIASVSQQKLMFVEGAQILSTLEAYTQKADGRRIPVTAKNILTQDSSLPQQAGMYFRDLKQRTIIFPDVVVGDTLVMTHRRESAKGTIFKHFSDNRQFPRSAGYTSVKVTVEAPVSAGVHVKVTGPGGVESANESGGVRRHTIVITPDSFAPDEADAVSTLDRDPTVLISTYNSYEELGSLYGQNALPKANVTPAIATLAGEITKGIADKKAQAVAIDAWMKKNIRYVAVYLSSGRIIPNDAMTVLKNKFGDCKDKTTLMAALLAAKGIASEPALINLGNAYTLAEPATFAALNHVILYLPAFDVYDDPTAQQAAFGVLALQAYDKPVVRVFAGGAKLSRTPAMKPDDHTVQVTTIVNVAADGAVTGQTEQSGTGALATALRAAASNVQTLGAAAAARRMLQVYLTPGSGNFDLGNSAETKDPVSIRSSFTLDDRFAAPAPGTRTIVSRGMPLTPLPGNFLLGTRLNGRKAPFVCYAGRQTEDIEATFEPPLPLPLLFTPVTIDNPAFSFRSTMRVEGRTMKLHREFISRVERQVCPPDLEAKIAAGLNAVRINVFSAFAFGAGQPTAAPRPAGTAAGQAPRNEVDEKGYIKNLANAFGTKPPPVQNPPDGPKPAALDKYVDQVNQANGQLAGKQAGTTTLPSNAVVAQSQPAAPNPLDPNLYYRLSTQFRGADMSLDVFNGGPKNNMTHLERFQDASGQYWKFLPAGDGSYQLTTMFRGSDMCLDIFNGGPDDNQPHLAPCSNVSGQFWGIRTENGWVRLTTKFRGGGMCLDIFSGGPNNNQPHLAPCANFSGQFWLLSQIDEVNQANGQLAVKRAGTTTPPSNPAVAQSQPAAPNPQVRSAPNAAAPSQPTEFSRVVPSGGKLRVEFLYSIQPDCSSAGQTTVRIVEKPQHGSVTIENGQDFTNFPKENQRYECNMRKSDGALVFYTPEPEFIGKDSITLDIIFPLGQSSKRHYSIDVR